MEVWDEPIMEKPNILRLVLCGTEDDGSVMMMLVVVGDRVVTRSVKPGPLGEQRVQWKESAFWFWFSVRVEEPKRWGFSYMTWRSGNGGRESQVIVF
ncbi:unnamed protein product [Prunus armeniaca]